MKPKGSQFADIQHSDPSQAGFQYPMFQTAETLRHGTEVNPAELNEGLRVTRGSGEKPDDFWNRKTSESLESGLHDSISGWERDDAGNLTRGGVREPVTINHDTNQIMNGYHRVAAAVDFDPKMEIPVSYGDYESGQYFDGSRDSVEGTGRYYPK